MGDAPQSSSVTGSGRPGVELGFVRMQGSAPKGRAKRGRRGTARAGVFGKAKRPKAGRILIRL